jgi:hypothetical protein
MTMLPEEFERRNQETRNAISLVISRWTRPSPFRSWAESERTLAEAYETRTQFWTDVIEYAIDHSDVVSALLFDAVLDAREGCEQEARHARDEAWQSAQRDQQRAFASYADNIAVAAGSRVAVAA